MVKHRRFNNLDYKRYTHLGYVADRSLSISVCSREASSSPLHTSKTFPAWSTNTAVGVPLTPSTWKSTEETDSTRNCSDSSTLLTIPAPSGKTARIWTFLNTPLLSRAASLL